MAFRLPRSLLLPLSLFTLLGSSTATTTVTIQPNSTRPTLIHCGPDCDIAYTVVEVSWEPTVSTILAHGDADSVSWTKYAYSRFFEQYSPQVVVDGTVATDSDIPDFTATCCDDAWYIQSGVTAQFETTTAETCEPTEVVFTGRAVGTVQSALPTELPFLEHDCEVSTTIIKTILTRVTIIAATPNPPTGTADGQSTWWEDGSDEITILLSPTPTPFFTISKCAFSGSSCFWSVGTMNVLWDQSTITITGNATELSSLEADLSTSIDDTEDWVNATLGWSVGAEASVPYCSESIWLDDEVTIDYGGWCPTTVLTGFNTILPVNIAYQFVNGEEADCNINIGGGIATTKTAIYIEKVTAETDTVGPTTVPPATREPDTLPTSTNSVITKETEVVESTSRTTTRRTTPRGTPRTTPRITPRTTTPRAGPQTTPRRRPTTTSNRQAQPVESPQPPDSSPPGPVNPPASSEEPVNPQPTDTPPNQGPGRPSPVNSPTQGPINPPNTQPNSPSNTDNPSINPPQDPTGANIPPQSSSPPNENPGAPIIIPGTPAPEPSLSTIFTSIPIVITTTDDSGSQTIISTFTTSPISTAVNIITTDEEGNTITTRVTFSNPTATALPVDGDGDNDGNGNTTEEPVPESQKNALVPGVTSRTTILTLTSRIGSGITVETRTSVIIEGEPTPRLETTVITGEESAPTATETGGLGPTGQPSKAALQKSVPLFAMVVISLLISILQFC